MFENILELINNNGNFIITSHVNPDGDSIGSEIALYLFFKKMGKNAKIINYSDTPDNYKFLDKNKVIEKFNEEIHKNTLLNTDVIFILDTNEYSRLRTMSALIKKSSAKKVCIDHHLGNDKNGFDYSLIDVDSPATGEILFHLFTSSSDNSIDSQIADALYTAIMTDTGSFRFPRTDSDTHNVAAQLIKSGTDPVKIYSEVYDKATPGRLKLLSKFLSNVELAYDDRLIYGTLLLKDFNETSTNVFDTEGFSHYLMSIDTVQISLIFTETQRGIKISFRSKDDIFVNELAKEFDGGGHKNAAGAFIVNGSGYGDLNEIKKEVILRSKKYLFIINTRS